MDQVSDPPEDGAETARSLVKAAVSVVPVVGSPLAEVLDLLWRAPLRRRQQRWMEDVARALRALEAQVEGLRVEDLAQNESFTSTLLSATLMAARTHLEDKLTALRNAVLNAAVGSFDDDLQVRLLCLVDVLSPWQLRLLALLDDPGGWYERQAITPPQMPMLGSLERVVEVGLPELAGKRNDYDPMVQDLYVRGLVGTDQRGLHATMTPDGCWVSRTTPFGKQLLRYISSPLGDEARDES